MGLAAEKFVAGLKQRTQLTPTEESVLLAGGIRSSAALLALTYSFPNLASKLNLDFPKLSHAATQGLTKSHAAFLTFAQTKFAPGALPRLSYGAQPPAKSPVQPGTAVPVPAAAPPAGGGPLAGQASQDVDRANWLVRNQANRGTCVSFASTGIREYAQFLAGQPESNDLSEQFLYWAIKQQPGEPWPTTDGTTLYYASQALQSYGVCNCSLWSYQQNGIPGNPGQGAPGVPSPPPIADAATRQVAGTYADMSQSASRALTLYNLLAANPRPVAVSLPVFGDPVTQQTGWTTPVSWNFGEVLDPLPTQVRVAGHAVIVTGFRPDPGETTGGYFILRNSWATSWASMATGAPAGQLSSGRAGYGIISATYIDKYLDETLVL